MMNWPAFSPEMLDSVVARGLDRPERRTKAPATRRSCSSDSSYPASEGSSMLVHSASGVARIILGSDIAFTPFPRCFCSVDPPVKGVGQAGSLHPAPNGAECTGSHAGSAEQI